MNIILAQTNNPSVITQPASTVATAVTTASMPEAASEHLQHRIDKLGNDFISSLGSTNFYIELFMVVGALVLAMLLAKILKEKIQKKIAISPPKFIDAEFIAKPLLLLGTAIAMFFLMVVQLLCISFDLNGKLTDGVMQITYSYFLIKCVLLVVRSRSVAYFISAAIIINSVLHAIRISRATTAYLDSIAFDAGKYHISALHLLHGLVIFVVVFWGAGILSRTLESYLRRSTSLSHTARELTVKFFRISIYIIAFAITLSAIGIDLTAFAVFSGALGVGIGLGLQKLTANFVSGITMLMEKSIKIGDIIDVSGNTGWVRQLNIRYALIETFDGREITVPNEELISTRVINWTLTTYKARIEIKITIDFESDAEKAHALLLQAANEHPRCIKDPAAACWLHEITGSGINFTLTFWIADIREGRNGPQSDVLFSILKRFQQAGINLAKTPAA